MRDCKTRYRFVTQANSLLYNCNSADAVPFTHGSSAFNSGLSSLNMNGHGQGAADDLQVSCFVCKQLEPERKNGASLMSLWNRMTRCLDAVSKFSAPG